MFSANENILLRQHKRKIVERVEKCIPEDVLDLGVNVMVMQVSCNSRFCVPLETAIIIVFPTSKKELLAGLSESAGGSFKTKILKPMAEVTDEDVLEALPPEFPGGLRSLERVALNARDVMLAQVEQLFEAPRDKRLMAQYLQQALQDYMDRGCIAPEDGEAFPPLPERPQENDTETNATNQQDKDNINLSMSHKLNNETTESQSFPTTGNIILKRPVDEAQDDKSYNNNRETSNTNTISKNTFPSKPVTTTTAIHANSALSSSLTTTTTTVSSSSTRRFQQNQVLQANIGSSDGTLRKLMEREHAPGIRRPGCPCCDPDNPSAVADSMLMF